MDKLPGTGLLCRVLAQIVGGGIVFRHLPLQVVRLTDVPATGGLAFQDVYEEGQPPRVGLEPTT